MAGVSDLRAMVQSEELPDARGDDNSTVRYWRRFMGFETLADPLLAEISPASQAARLSGPLLLIHGRNDTVVPYRQSEQMVEAAGRVTGSQVRLVALDGEDHYLSAASTRVQMLTQLIAFIKEHNPAD